MPDLSVCENLCQAIDLSKNERTPPHQIAWHECDGCSVFCHLCAFQISVSHCESSLQKSLLRKPLFLKVFVEIHCTFMTRFFKDVPRDRHLELKAASPPHPPPGAGRGAFMSAVYSFVKKVDTGSKPMNCLHSSAG